MFVFQIQYSVNEINRIEAGSLVILLVTFVNHTIYKCNLVNSVLIITFVKQIG